MYIIVIVFVSFVSAYGNGPIKWVAINKDMMAADMMQLVKRFQHMKKYEVWVTHASYENYTTTVSHQTSKGYFIRDNKNYHNFLLGIHTIQENGCRIVIDSAKKVMMLADPTDANDSIMPVSDYSMLYGLCSSIKQGKEGNMTFYRLEFGKQYYMSAMEFVLEDSLPAKIIMYYAKSVKSGNKMTKPRLEIEYSNWAMKISDAGTAFDIEAYVKRDGNRYFLRKNYLAKYKLLDERVLTRNNKKQKP